MKPRKPQYQQPQTVNHCVDCTFAEVDTAQINRTAYDGRPFMLKCHFTPWKKFKTDPACDRFARRQTPLDFNV